jgi:Fic family protein
MNPDIDFIINLLRGDENLSATQVSNGSKIGLRTTQRLLQELTSNQIILKTGHGKNTAYSLSPIGILNYEPDVLVDLDETRLEKPIINFNFEIFNWLQNFDFSKAEKQDLQAVTEIYGHKLENSNPNLRKKEYQRLVVEFSWKSSSIEGDTYSLLDTERLLLEGISNPNKTKAETQMILNHKQAFDFIFENPDYFKAISTKKINELHQILTHNLEVSTGFRKSGVGITGSLYKPLGDQHQIQEAVDKLSTLLNKTKNPYLKAMFASLLIAYIQPFEDGNKRTSRVLANAILYSYNLPLLSYRNTNIEAYRNSILSFYELNSLFLFKKIFIDQVEFFSVGYF